MTEFYSDVELEKIPDHIILSIVREKLIETGINPASTLIKRLDVISNKIFNINFANEEKMRLNDF